MRVGLSSHFSEERAEEIITGFFVTAGNRLPTALVKAGALRGHHQGLCPSCRLARLRREQMTPCQQGWPLFLPLLSSAAGFSSELPQAAVSEDSTLQGPRY